MKTNYLKLNSWAVAALMGMCPLAACSDDNSGEGGGNGVGRHGGGVRFCRRYRPR